jgi:hypothetical protein
MLPLFLPQMPNKQPMLWLAGEEEECDTEKSDEGNS